MEILDGPIPFAHEEDSGFLFECPKVLHLNVGGERFVTTKSTLCSKGSNFFYSLLTHRAIGSTVDETGAYFIDRDGEAFRFVLEFFRTGDVELESMEKRGVSRKTLRREAEFYCLVDLVELIDNHEEEITHKEQMEKAATTEKSEPLRKDGYYLIDNNGGQPTGLCEAIAFLEDGKCVFSTGSHAANNLVVYRSVHSLPDLWKEVEVGEIYARFVTHSINRGRYWMDGHSMKLCLRNTLALLAVAKSNTLYINSEEDDFVKYTFIPWP